MRVVAIATEPSERTIVLNLLRGAVPEQADRLCKLWVDHGPDVEVAPSSRGATMNSTSKRIKFDTKTIDLFWLIGFALWRAIALYSPAVVCATRTDLTIDQILADDDERPQLEFDHRQRMSAIVALLEASDTDEIAWPDEIPRPTADRDSLKDCQEKAAFDLVLFALTFAILHELRHVMFRKAGDAPAEKSAEEMLCDTWAREVMTGKMANYSRETGHAFAEVAQKRATGIALAAIIVHAMTAPSVRWGTDEYPPIADRLTAMIAGYSLPDDSHFWLFTACLLVATLRQDRVPVDVSEPSYKAMVETLLDRLR
jgi:hypothetical protein